MWRDAFCQVVSKLPKKFAASLLTIEIVLPCGEEIGDLHSHHMEILVFYGVDSFYLGRIFLDYLRLSINSWV
jgi:hypothetical protein